MVKKPWAANNLPKRDVEWKKKITLAFLLRKYPPEVAKQKVEWQYG